MDDARSDAQVGGDVPVGPPAMDEADDLESIAELAVSGLRNACTRRRA